VAANDGWLRQVLNPILADYKRWEGNDIYHVWGDLSGWLAVVPSRVQDYFTDWSIQDVVQRVAEKTGTGNRWYQSVM
jgi:hypothetical protein